MRRSTEELAAAPRMDQDRAHSLFEREAATFVDVRDEYAFDRSHIPGAISAPILELVRHLDEIPRGRPVITY